MKRLLIFMITILTCLMMYGNVYAAESGTNGTCSWVIDDNGVLTISPTDGVSGTFAYAATSGNGPWFNYRSDIKKVVVNPGVKAGTSCFRLFYCFSNCTEMDLNNLDTSNVTNMNSMFNGCNILTSLDVSGFDTSKVTTMYRMFYICKNLTSLDVSRFDTGNVTTMYQMFYGCSKLTSLDVSKFNTGNVTNMSSMFESCSKLTSLDVSGFDTSNVTTMSSMFSSCSKLPSLDVSKFDTGNVTNMYCMFSGCKNLTSLDVSKFDTGNVTNMYCMFYGCSSLTSLDVSRFNTSNVTRLDSMFSNCSNLQEVDLGENFSFKGRNITSTSKQAALPTPPSATTTQKWIREDEAYGPYTPAELRDNYASEMAGKWIWKEKPINYTVKFLPPDNENYGGSMVDQKINAEEVGTLNENSFYRFNYHFDHWDNSNGNTYEDKASIPANTFKAGDVLTLTAVFEKNDNRLVFTDGEAEVMIRAGEKISLPTLPGGTTYQVYEETPSGWQMVEQTGAAGIIPANGVADSSFVNEYVPGTATISLIAQKTLDGRAPSDGQFTFELLQGDEVVQTVSNNAAGMVTFDQLVFKQPGTFIYKIREVRGEDASISYDSHVETITVTVEDDGHGNLTATKSIGDTVPSFENETKPGTLQVSKEAAGGTGEDVFTFEITLTDDYGRSLDDISILGAAE